MRGVIDQCDHQRVDTRCHRNVLNAVRLLRRARTHNNGNERNCSEGETAGPDAAKSVMHDLSIANRHGYAHQGIPKISSGDY